MDPFLDGELDLHQAGDVRQHLGACEECNITYRNLLTLSSSLKENSLYHHAPGGLQKRIQLSLREEVATATPRRSFREPWLVLGAAVAVLLLIVTALKVVPRFDRPSFDERIAQEIVSNHIRSLQSANHLTDVLSSDQHTVKPWFNGRVDFSPPVKDFAAEDFRLYGARLDYIDNRTVATLVYQRRLHYINLYIWPAERFQTKAIANQRQGYNIIHWSSSGMSFWAVSDLNSVELNDFAQLLQ
jgi:anti-sigma factor RsiW